MIKRTGYYSYNNTQYFSQAFYAKEVTFDYSLKDSGVPTHASYAGTETFEIYNYSASPVTIRAGITSGIHIKGEELFFEDTDFCLADF